MKVLMINVVCGIRSTGRICTDLATELEKQGHEVKIAYGREQIPQQFQKYAVRIGSDFDVKLHVLKARLLDAAGFGSKRATEKFIEWVREYDPDVIHLHNIHGYYINIEILFKYLKICGKKIIWTLHDCWAFTGHSAYCDTVNCERWIKGCGKCPLLNEYPKTYMDRSIENWKKKKTIFTGVPNMTLVTPSEWLKRLVLKSFLSDYSTQVIYNGLDTSNFYPKKSDFKKKHSLEDKIMLLGVATVWNDLKGYSDFVKLSRKLDDTYKIVLVGLTDEQIRKLPSEILGIRRTADAETLSYIYSAADIFLNLTYCDSFGQTNVEAALCGTPIIAYDTGGCKESVGKNGYIIEQGDLDEVINKISLLKNKKIFIDDKLENRFNTSIMIRGYLEIFDEIKI